MSEQWYTFTDELTELEEKFFDLVDNCDVPAAEEFLANNRININKLNYQGITPLQSAVQDGCEPLVDLILRQNGECPLVHCPVPIPLPRPSEWM